MIWPVQSCVQKDSASRLPQIKSISSAVPPPYEGRFAIVTDARRDAMDAGSAARRTALDVDGKVVWS
jgi:hypothetical protein